MSVKGIANPAVFERYSESALLVNRVNGLEIMAMNFVSEALRRVGSLHNSLPKTPLAFRTFNHERWGHDRNGRYTVPFQATISPSLWVEGEIVIDAPKNMWGITWAAEITFTLVNNFQRGREYHFSGKPDSSDGSITITKE